MYTHVSYVILCDNISGRKKRFIIRERVENTIKKKKAADVLTNVQEKPIRVYYIVC